VTVVLIRDGQEEKVRGIQAFQEMILQICMNYPVIPDIRTMDLDEIEFFYEGLKPTLKKITKPK